MFDNYTRSRPILGYNQAIKIDQIIHSRRRTIAIQVERDGRVIVRAPLYANRQFIEQVVAEKAGWIASKQAELARQQDNCGRPPGPPRFAPGERFLFLGESYPLVIVARQARPLALHEGVFRLRQSDLPRAAALFEAWYKTQARRILTERVHFYAAANRLTPGSIRLSSARTRWGSCSPSGTLSFTWRLVMAPPQALDYVVVHELAHLLEKNHAAPFWNKVAAMLPGYLPWKKWLKDNAACLTWV